MGLWFAAEVCVVHQCLTRPSTSALLRRARTSVPALCAYTAARVGGVIQKVFLRLTVSWFK